MYYTDKINEVNQEIGGILKSSQTYTPSTVGKSITMAAYMLYKASKANKVPDYKDIKDHSFISSESTVSAFRLLINEESWNNLTPLLEKYSSDTFRVAVFDNAADEFSTPNSIIKLVSRILDVRSVDTVADIGCGTGTFLTSVAMSTPDASFYGCEIDLVASEIAKIRSELLAEDHPEINFTIESFDAFVLNQEKKYSFDKIFSNYPFGITTRNGSGRGYLEYVSGKAPGIKRVRSADWLYNHLAVEMLKEGGKTVVIMPDGGLFNNLDKDIREYFLEQGWIEAVIKLPDRLFSYTMIGTNLVILSKGNKGIRFVDASHIYQQERRIRSFSDDDIDAILKMIREDGDHSIVVKNADVMNNDAILLPTDHIKVTDKLIENLPLIPLSSVTESVFRGAPINAKELDALTSHEETDYQFLNLSNIQDGRVEDNLPFLTEISDKYRKYCLQDEDLILSKNNVPFKLAVAKVDKKHIVANGNLYVLRLNKEKILPYYLQAYFKSDIGQRALERISTGTALKSISVDSLRKMQIPVPDMEVQKKIADAFESKVQELALLEKKVKRVRLQIDGVFDAMIDEGVD